VLFKWERFKVEIKIEVVRRNVRLLFHYENRVFNSLPAGLLHFYRNKQNIENTSRDGGKSTILFTYSDGAATPEPDPIFGYQIGKQWHSSPYLFADKFTEGDILSFNLDDDLVENFRMYLRIYDGQNRI
jgi:hypothetical protein